MAKRKQTDWEGVEKQYRLGQKSMRTLAEEFGVHASNISRRAKKEGWVQDKSEEVRQRTNATLIAQQQRNTPTREDIEVAVQTNKQVILGHRKVIGDGLKIIDLLHGQLQESVLNRAEIEEQILDETKEDQTTQRRNMMLKAISLPANAATLRDLSAAMKNTIPLQRQAFGIDVNGGGSGEGDQGGNGRSVILDEERKAIREALTRARLEREARSRGPEPSA